MSNMHLETSHFVSELKDNIMCVEYKPNLSISLIDAERIVSERLLYYQDLNVPVLIRNAKVKKIEKDAREFLFEKEKGLKNVKAVAIVCSNIVTKMLATFIFHHHKPAIPHRMFTDEQKAINWLKQYI